MFIIILYFFCLDDLDDRRKSIFYFKRGYAQMKNVLLITNTLSTVGLMTTSAATSMTFDQRRAVRMLVAADILSDDVISTIRQVARENCFNLSGWDTGESIFSDADPANLSPLDIGRIVKSSFISLAYLPEGGIKFAGVLYSRVLAEFPTDPMIKMLGEFVNSGQIDLSQVPSEHMKLRLKQTEFADLVKPPAQESSATGMASEMAAA